MRGVGLFFGMTRRNVPVRLTDPHPVADYGNDVCSGDAGRDGFTVLSRANPSSQGDPPMVADGRVPQGPDQSFEQ
jgi:hypothetical protein